MKFSRPLSVWLTLLLFAGHGAAWGQERSGAEPAMAPASELSPPPLISAPGTTDWPSREQPALEDEDTSEPEGPGETAPVSVREPARPSRAAARVEDPVPRVAVELVGGAAGGIVAGTLGLVAGYALALPTVGCDECRVVSLVGGFAGVLIGVPAGTFMGGRLMGGKGTLLGAAGGSLVGWSGALLGSLLLNDAGNNDALALALLVLPIAGATAGYELTQSSAPPTLATPHASSQPALHVVPVAGMTQHGPRLGLLGRF